MWAPKLQREAFIGAMQREFPEHLEVVELCRLLMRNATTYGHLQRMRVRRELTPHEWRRETRTWHRIVQLCGQFPTRVIPQLDHAAEGSIRVYLPSGQSEAPHHPGWSVPIN